ncbi:MAG: AAA family ATPase [Gammaproteobacteria bacterium]|nr:AAA family ATPase [Gammaproteobacteria bacterium]
MYETYYKLSNDPFRLLPDAGICFPHRSNARAWAYLRYALRRGEGIVVVTGPPGSGKTTLSQRLLGETNPSKVISVRLVANDLTPMDLLRKLAYALGLPVEGKDRAMLSLLIERHLVEVQLTQRRVLVVIDEAQTLSHQSLEAMRLLTDLQSQSQPVLQLVLFGQQELEGVMSAPGMEQFQHRVIASCRLQPMDLMETKAYLEYRLAAANWRGDPSISGPAVMAIYRYSRGVPRHVNKIGSRLMLHGSSEERHALDDSDVNAVVGDLRKELLAPLGHDSLPEIVDNQQLQSVYELALVPSAIPQPPPSVARAMRDERDSAPLPAERSAPESHASKPYRDVRGHDRYLLRVGRRSGSRSRYRVRRRLRRYWTRLLYALAELRQGRSGVVARLRHWRGAVTSALGRSAQTLGQRAAAAVAALRTQARRPLFGFPTAAVAAAGVGVAVLGGLLLADRGDVGDAVIESSRQLGDAEAPTYVGPGILDEHGGFVISGADAGAIAPAVDTLQAVMRGGFLTTTGIAGAAIGELLGGQPLAPVVAPAARARLALDGSPADRTLVTAISDETAAGLLSATGRFDSSLTVWTIARDPDAVSREGINVWSLNGRDQRTELTGVIIRPLEDTDSEPADVTVVETPPGHADREPALAAAADAAAPASLPAAVRSGDVHAVVDAIEALPTTAAGVPPRTADGADAPASGVAVTPILAAPVLPDDALPAATAIGGDPHGTALAAAGPDAGLDPEAVGTSADAAPTEPAAVRTDIDTAVASPAGQVAEGTEFEIAADVEQVQSLPVSEAPLRVAAIAAPSPDVEALIAKAGRAIAADRLLMPEARSAYRYLRQVLEIDPDNADAQRGIERIVDRYARLALRALRAEDYDKAERFANRGLRVKPDSARMQSMRREIVAARDEAEAVALAEAEMARLAAEAAARPKPKAPPPKKAPPSTFERFLQLVEGI